MSVVRAISGVGLILLLAIALFALFISFRNQDWVGVLIGIGFVSLIAFLFDMLRVEASRNSPGRRVPSKAIVHLFFLCGGAGLGIAGISNLLSEQWWSAAVKLFFAATLLVTVFTEWYLGYRQRA